MIRRRSRLQLYVAALKTLAVNGPMNMTKMMLKVRVNSNLLKRILVDLAEKNLVEQRTCEGKKVYAVTPKTRTMLSHFKENQIIPITEITSTIHHLDRCCGQGQQGQHAFEQLLIGES